MIHKNRAYYLNLIRFTIITAALAAVMIVGVALYWQVNRLIFAYRIPVTGEPIQLGQPYREVAFTTADGLEISAWHIDGPRAEAIILVHGVDANRLAMTPEAQLLSQAGYQLLMLDLRGHGLSEGEYKTYGYLEALDVQAATDYLARSPQVDHIGVIGHSYGGAAVARAASQDSRLEAVVLQSTYSSMITITHDSFNRFAFLPEWPFAPLIISLAEERVGLQLSDVDSTRELATMSPRPLMIIHGREDSLIPVEQAYELYRAAPHPKWLWIINNMGHMNAAHYRPDLYAYHVVTFFEYAFAN